MRAPVWLKLGLWLWAGRNWWAAVLAKVTAVLARRK
jgi:hypothetical protein